MKQYTKVNVCMITYGHEKYIRQAIEGILMQQCDFEVELIVANDCSPDATDQVIRDIIKSHPRGSWIKYIKNDKNLGMMSNFIFVMQECKGKYIALCDGDDFWTDPLKLQKQVEFLDNNKDYNLCHSDVNLIDKYGELNKNTSMKLWNYTNNHLDYRFSIFHPIAFTCTAVFRNINITDRLQININSGDWMLWILATLGGNAKFINEKLAVYRTGVGVSNHIIWHKNFGYRSLFLLKQLSLRISFKKNYWLLRGAIYFSLIYISRKLDFYFIAKVANKFNLKAR